MTPVEELAALLRPAGGGIHLVSTGREAQAALVRRLAGAGDDAQVEARWRGELEHALGARAVLLGIPCDVGAGYRRGANLAPAAIRAHLLEQDPGWFDRARAAGLVDLGDVFTVPQLLHDEMLSEAQLAATRRALYPGLHGAGAWPVSPLSIAERAFRLLLQANPGVRLLTLGGDHSAAWPAVAALAAARPGLGVVQLDAHTDLLPERLGVRLCFGTWSFHANDLLGRGGRLVQVGLRASRHDRDHWESTLGVRQVWAAEVRRDPAAALERVVALCRAAGVGSVYLSNDVDGLDPAFAPGTGTPEPDGLSLEFVLALIERLGREFQLCGGDVMEVAPDLAPTPEGRRRTLDTAVQCLRLTVAATLGATP
jgi:arginase family enzyme